jgi:uncharacterized membrane protein
MNASQLHLALTHLPVVLSLVGMIALLVSYIKTNTSLRKTALYILVIAGVAALPVFFSGEGAEEVVENLPGVSGSLIEKHEAVAKLGLFAILAAAVLALISLPRFVALKLKNGIAISALVVSFISTGLMVQTAHLGGQIRHTEIRNGAAPQGESSGNEHDD